MKKYAGYELVDVFSFRCSSLLRYSKGLVCGEIDLLRVRRAVFWTDGEAQCHYLVL